MEATVHRRHSDPHEFLSRGVHSWFPTGSLRLLGRACPRTVHSGRRRRQETLIFERPDVRWNDSLLSHMGQKTVVIATPTATLTCRSAAAFATQASLLGSLIGLAPSPNSTARARALAGEEGRLSSPSKPDRWSAPVSNGAAAARRANPTKFSKKFPIREMRQASKRSKLQRQSFVPYGTKIGRSGSGHGYGCMSQNLCAAISELAS